MRLNMTQQGGLSDEFVSGGGSVINPLFLAADPVVPLGASTKQYVDNSLQSLNANNLISGTIGAARFPAMNGDLSSSAGSTSLILTNTGVTPGAYAKVSVDNKGRILNGLLLSESDIPDISWDKITLNKPTTVDGYGIQDALKVTGGTMTGNLSVTGTPTQANQLINKTYLDSVVGGTTGIVIGDIIAKTDSTTPSGFLKCNGAELVKTSYQDLYNVIGDRYTTNGKTGNGQPWRNQYDINLEYNSDIINWRTIQSLPGILGGATSFITKNRIYIYGGHNGSSNVGTGYTAAINADGTLGPWSAATALPGAFAYTTSIVVKNKVYLIGGNSTSYLSTVYVADINADGTLGTWGNGPNLPAGLGHSRAFINNKVLYVVGGVNSSNIETNVIYSSIIKDDGSLNNWVTENPLPVTSAAHFSINTTNNRVYILGGSINSSQSNKIYSASLNSDGSLGSWGVYGVMPITASTHQSFITRNTIFIISGSQNGSLSPNVYKANINSDGTIGNWNLSSWTMTGNLQYTNLAIANNKVYMCGGLLNSAWTANCWVADINGGLNDYSSFYSNNLLETNYMVAGSGKPWQQQYQINETQTGDIIGWINDTPLEVPIANSASIVTKNRVYLFGNGDGSLGYSTVYTAPINSDGTLGAWVTDTALPGAVSNSQAVTIGNRVYLICSRESGAPVYTGKVYTASINSDGTIGTWSLTTSVPVAMVGGQAIVTRNRIYMIGGHNGTSALSTIYFATVYPDGSLSSWTSATSLPVAITNSQAVVTKNRVYLLGGHNGTNALNTIYTAAINSDGSIGVWVNSGTLPTTIHSSLAFISNNTVYLLGGNTGSGFGTIVSTVYSAPINSDGILGTWVARTSLPGPLSQSQVIATQNKIYLIGGHDGTSYVSTVYSAPILEGLNDYSACYTEDTTNYLMPGSGKPWQQQYQINETQSTDITGLTVGVSLPGILGGSTAIVTKNRVYLCGGYTTTVSVSTVYTAPINTDGTLGTWTTSESLPGTLSNSTSVITKNRVYLFSGHVNATHVTTVYTAIINADGTLGAWATGTSLPGILSNSQAIITKNRVYLLGGYNGTTAISTVYTATINSDGLIGTWTTGPSLPGGLAMSTAIVTKNRVYLCGGVNDAGTNRTNIVYTATINSDGLIGTWTTGPSLPGAANEMQAIVTKDRAYLIGGRTSLTTFLSTAYTAVIDNSGKINSWNTYSLDIGSNIISHSQAIITKNRLYILGGYNNTGQYDSTVYYATILNGLNDYSSYYNGDITAHEQFITVAKFKLPDASYMNDGLNYFIKY